MILRRYIMAAKARNYSDWLDSDPLDSDWVTRPSKDEATEDVSRMFADISASFSALFLGKGQGGY